MKIESGGAQFTSCNLNRGTTESSLGPDLYAEPMKLFDQTPSGDILGQLGDWVAIFKTVQLADENDPSTADFMLVLKIQDATTPSKVTIKQCLPAAKAILTFLSLYSSNSAVGYNISGDNPNKIKAGQVKPPQSFGLWHLHFTRFPENMEQLDRTPERLFEEDQNFLDSVLSNYFKRNIPKDSEFIKVVQDRKSNIFPMGGVVLESRDDINPAQLATILQQIDNAYRSFHKSVFGLYVSNYDEVKDSGWNKPYELEEHVVPTDIPAFRSPTYSVAIDKSESRIRILFKPHLNRHADWLNTLGIVTDRRFVDADDPNARYNNRRQRAKEVFDSIMLN